MGYTPPTLYVNKIAGGWSLTPPDNTTTDDLIIYANATDGTSYIKLEGLGGITNRIATGGSFTVSDGTVIITCYNSGNDKVIDESVADKNLFLKTNGTGVIKFGTYTAGAATDSTGYITILDAAGNTRKLMVQA